MSTVRWNIAVSPEVDQSVRMFLDTNILLGTLIALHGPPDTIYRAWRAARFDLVTAVAQLDELRRASRYLKLKAIVPAHRIVTPATFCAEVLR